jgi:hypothetical protein
VKQAMLLLAALVLASAVGCGGSNSGPAQGQELTPDQVAEQEAVLKAAEAAEAAERMKQSQR